jgi:sec-independent protein translocase protein TatB
MLPSLGFQEIVLLAIIALVVVGPKDLPLLFRKLGRWTAKLRGMAQEFRTGFDELARQAELDELKREVDALRRTTSLQEIRSELTKPLPTLEDYAGIAKPKPSPALAAPEVEAPVDRAPAEAEASTPEEMRPASDDRQPLDLEPPEAQPVARSAP